ncbi:hypothetical protein Lal_00020637 [Lupinus albus]|uniref:Putative transcription factor Nin-like family n=1 Tax=Lupinus albus TaxID=3870 RepID=A0A6A4Q6F3_LUPAL|nr:putative transcription factor Nin-like family [Lupinus albus]KAF1871842.1 hypothetical protein Lal_00020637 [Lupinus albus]
MGDPQFVLPYHESYDIPLHPNLFNLINNNTNLLNTLPQQKIHNGLLQDVINNATLLSSPSQQIHHHPIGNNGLQDVNHNSILAPMSQPLYCGHGNNGVQEVNHNNQVQSFMDPLIQDHSMHNMSNNYFLSGGGIGGGSGGSNNFEAGPSQVHAQSSSQPLPKWNLLGSPNFNNIDVMPLSYWPEPPTRFSCTCCQVLREILHTNGNNFNKLEIHGRLGMICHAIYHQNIIAWNNNWGASFNPQIQMIDFSTKNIQEIKNFLVEYCLGQCSSGYAMVQDPFYAYYEALCTGFDWADDLDDYIDLNPNTSGGQSDEMEQEVENGRVSRLNLAEKRERIAKMNLSDLSDYFHMPIGEAARRLDLCVTAVKKVCRRGDLERWPHRKIKSVVKQIRVLRRSLNSADAMTRARTEADIIRLEELMRQHCGGIAPTAINYNP